MNYIEDIMQKLCAECRTVFGDKLEKVILYGSQARGDFDSESDVDVIVLADIDASESTAYRKKLLNVTSALGLQYDTLVSVVVCDLETYVKWKDILPYFMNIEKDGINYAA